MAKSADPDQLASSEANWSGSTLFAKACVYPGSAGQRLIVTKGIHFEKKHIIFLITNDVASHSVIMILQQQQHVTLVVITFDYCSRRYDKVLFLIATRWAENTHITWFWLCFVFGAFSG